MDFWDFVFDRIDHPADGGRAVEQDARASDDFEAFDAVGFERDCVIRRGGRQVARANPIQVDLHAVPAQAANDRARGRRPHAANGNADFIFDRFGEGAAVFPFEFVSRERARDFAEGFKAGFGVLGDHIQGVHFEFPRGHRDVQDGHFRGGNRDFPARCAVANARKGEAVRARGQAQGESPALIAQGDSCALAPSDVDIFNRALGRAVKNIAFEQRGPLRRAERENIDQGKEDGQFTKWAFSRRKPRLPCALCGSQCAKRRGGACPGTRARRSARRPRPIGC